MSSAVQAVRAFYTSLLAGDANGLTFMFGGPPKIDTPIEGTVEGSASLQRFASEQKTWLSEREAEVEEVAVTETPKAAIAEILLHLKQDDEEIGLPVALIADLAGGMVVWLRIYHGTRSLTATPGVREPLLKRSTRLGEPQPIKDYFAALRKPDKKKVLSLFTPDGQVREAAGESVSHAGAEELDRFYSGALAKGGIPMVQCSAIFDGERCAIEYNCDCSQSATLPPQAGCAVFEMDSEEKITSVQIYDDIAPLSGTGA